VVDNAGLETPRGDILASFNFSTDTSWSVWPLAGASKDSGGRDLTVVRVIWPDEFAEVDYLVFALYIDEVADRGLTPPGYDDPRNYINLKASAAVNAYVDEWLS
jgi:hypothetical protein